MEYQSIKEAMDSNFLYAVLVAAILAVVTLIVMGIASKLIRKIMQKDGSPLPESSIIVNIVRTGILLVGLSIILSTCFNVNVTGLLGALGIGGLAVSLGMQGTIENIVGGLQVTLLGVVEPGDHVVVGAVEGIVEDVSLRETTVKDFEGTIHLIPNALINSTTVDKIEPSTLVSTLICFNNDGRDLDSMVREAEVLAKAAVEKVAPLAKDPWILLTQIGEYGAWAKLRFVLEDVTHAREARDAALRVLAPYTRNDSKEILGSDGGVAQAGLDAPVRQVDLEESVEQQR